MSTINQNDYARLEHADAPPTLQFRRRLSHSPDVVWRALTEPEQLAAWFPTTIDGEREAGAKLQFRFEQVEMPPMAGEMLEFESPSLLALRWGGDVLRFELEPDGAGTALTFTVVLEELGKATRDGAGWHQCLDSLDRSLSGSPARPDDPDRWRVLRDVYAEQFGPEASALGPPQEWKDAHGEA